MNNWQSFSPPFSTRSTGFKPVNIQAESRARYIAALRAFQLEDDPFPFVGFFCTNLLDRLKKTEQQLSGKKAPEAAAKKSPITTFLESE